MVPVHAAISALLGASAHQPGLAVSVSSHESATFPQGGGDFCGKAARLSTRQGLLQFTSQHRPRPIPKTYFLIENLARTNKPLAREPNPHQHARQHPPHPTSSACETTRTRSHISKQIACERKPPRAISSTNFLRWIVTTERATNDFSSDFLVNCP